MNNKVKKRKHRHNYNLRKTQPAGIGWGTFYVCKCGKFKP